MRLIDLEVDPPGLLQSSEFAEERLLTGVSLMHRCRPEAAVHREITNGRHRMIAVIPLTRFNACFYLMPSLLECCSQVTN